jgi:hypothetical protein
MHARHLEVQPGSDSLLLELHRAHDFIVQAMEGLIRLTGSSRADEAQLREARLKLDHASIRRQLLWADILHFLSSKVGRFAKGQLQRLQEIDIELVRASAEHARTWTAEAIFANWPGYCEASGAIRSKMIAAMEAEKRILYPLLRNIAVHPGQPNGADSRKGGKPDAAMRLAS